MITLGFLVTSWSLNFFSLTILYSFFSGKLKLMIQFNDWIKSTSLWQQTSPPLLNRLVDQVICDWTVLRNSCTLPDWLRFFILANNILTYYYLKCFLSANGHQQSSSENSEYQKNTYIKFSASCSVWFASFTHDPAFF